MYRFIWKLSEATATVADLNFFCCYVSYALVCRLNDISSCTNVARQQFSLNMSHGFARTSYFRLSLNCHFWKWQHIWLWQCCGIAILQYTLFNYLFYLNLNKWFSYSVRPVLFGMSQGADNWKKIWNIWIKFRLFVSYLQGCGSVLIVCRSGSNSTIFGRCGSGSGSRSWTVKSKFFQNIF